MAQPSRRPPPEKRELFCRDGLKYYARIPAKNIKAALEEIEVQRGLLDRARPRGDEQVGLSKKLLLDELDFAAQMAAHSCKFMLWQQAIAAGRNREAKAMAKRNTADLRQLDDEFKKYWPWRNKGTTQTSTPFLQWRIADYRRGTLPIPPEVAAIIRASTSAD